MAKTYKEIEGWFPEENAKILERIILENDIKTIIEVGSYKGRSAAFFASLPSVEKVYCVDPFISWQEGENNRCVKQGESFYGEFEQNMKDCGANEKVVAYKMTSLEAASMYPDFKADLIYIDAAHDMASVSLDIQLWYAKANKVIAGDDYDENWKGVKKAVDLMVDDYQVENNIWIKIKK